MKGGQVVKDSLTGGAKSGTLMHKLLCARSSFSRRRSSPGPPALRKPLGHPWLTSITTSIGSRLPIRSFPRRRAGRVHPALGEQIDDKWESALWIVAPTGRTTASCQG